MAARAEEVLVSPFQDEAPRDGRMVEGFPVPCSERVTHRAVLGISAPCMLALKVSLVARHTVGCVGGIEKDPTASHVAGGTVDALMRALEPESTRVRLVIERGHIRPTHRSMARQAVRREAEVDVVDVS